MCCSVVTKGGREGRAEREGQGPRSEKEGWPYTPLLYTALPCGLFYWLPHRTHDIKEIKHEQVGLDSVLEFYLPFFLFSFSCFFLSIFCISSLTLLSTFLLFSAFLFSFSPISGFVISLYLFLSKPAVEFRYFCPLLEIYKKIFLHSTLSILIYIFSSLPCVYYLNVDRSSLILKFLSYLHIFILFPAFLLQMVITRLHSSTLDKVQRSDGYFWCITV